MFSKLIKLIKSKKAQNTAEYALMISLVIAGVIAMQTYAQRAWQGKIRDASTYLTNRTNALGTTAQYEPYYLSSSYEIKRDSFEREFLRQNGLAGMNTESNQQRASGGFQVFDYQTSFGLINGI